MAMITTVQQHILQQQQDLLKSTGREATGTFSWLLSGITLATKMIEAKIRAAGLSDVLGRQARRMFRVNNSRSWMCMRIRLCCTALVYATVLPRW